MLRTDEDVTEPESTNVLIESELDKLLTENDLDELLKYLIGILKSLLDIAVSSYEVRINVKNNTQFESIIGIFRAKYRNQAGVEKSVLTALFEKQGVTIQGVY